MKILFLSVLLIVVVNVKCCKQDPCATVRCAGTCISNLRTCTYRCIPFPKPRPCTSNPCLVTLCAAGTTCTLNPVTCNAECVKTLTTPCKEDPCMYARCTATTKCVVDPETCTSQCVPYEPVLCTGNECSGISCGATATCMVNENTCQPECVQCNNVMDPCWTCVDKSKCTVEGCVGTCHDDIILE